MIMIIAKRRLANLKTGPALGLPLEAEIFDLGTGPRLTFMFL